MKQSYKNDLKTIFSNIYVWIIILVASLFFSMLIFIIPSEPKSTDTLPTDSTIKRNEYVEVITKNGSLKADSLGLSLCDIVAHSSSITFIIDHYQGDMITIDNQKALDSLGNLIYYYTHEITNLEYEFKFTALQNTSHKNNGNITLQQHDDQYYLLFNDQEIPVTIIDESLGDASYEGIIKNNERLEALGYTIHEYTHIYLAKKEYYKSTYDEYTDALNYNNYEEFHQTHPDLTEDEAQEIYDYFKNKQDV